jgi:hypothetical protein
MKNRGSKSTAMLVFLNEDKSWHGSIRVAELAGETNPA